MVSESALFGGNYAPMLTAVSTLWEYTVGSPKFLQRPRMEDTEYGCGNSAKQDFEEPLQELVYAWPFWNSHLLWKYQSLSWHLNTWTLPDPVLQGEVEKYLAEMAKSPEAKTAR